MADDVERLTAGQAIEVTKDNTDTIGKLYALRYVSRDIEAAAPIIDQTIAELGQLNAIIATLRAKVSELETQGNYILDSRL